MVYFSLFLIQTCIIAIDQARVAVYNVEQIPLITKSEKELLSGPLSRPD